MNSIKLGQHYVSVLVQSASTSHDVADILRTNFAPTELVQLELHPDHGVLVVHGKEKVVEIKLTVKHLPQYVGQFKAGDLIKQSKHWVEHAHNTIRQFKEHEDVYLVYFPDYKILKVASMDDTKVEYIKDVVWSIE